MSDTKSMLTPHFEDGGRLMITNGGPHPPDLWAQATAEHIAPLGNDLTGKRRIAAMALQAKIIEVLEPHYTAAQEAERDHLVADEDRLLSEMNPPEHVDAAVRAVCDAAKGTEWEAHFSQPDVIATIHEAMMHHFATAQHIERGWHIDRNPAHPHAATFNAMRGRA
jgi:hypothetical protein